MNLEKWIVEQIADYEEDAGQVQMIETEARVIGEAIEELGAVIILNGEMTVIPKSNIDIYKRHLETGREHNPRLRRIDLNTVILDGLYGWANDLLEQMRGVDAITEEEYQRLKEDNE